jgi:hypothetical protein
LEAAMQHYAHWRDAPRWGASENRKSRRKLRQIGDELQQQEHRFSQQKRASWTAPVKFGRDTIKPIEAHTYNHLLLAQEQEARNKKFEEDIHFETRNVRSPVGTHSPLKICVPPLRMERIKSDGLPKALAGVDIGSLLALAHVKENIKNQGEKRYGAFTYRSGSTLSSKEAFWATNLCAGRSEKDYVRTVVHPELFSKEITSAGEKRKQFLARYSSCVDAKGPPNTATDGLDIRTVGWAPYREGLSYRAHPKYTDPQYTYPAEGLSSARAATERSARARAKKAWDESFVVNHEKKGFIDTTLQGIELQRENQRKEQEARTRGEHSWTAQSNPLHHSSSDLPKDFVF